MTTSGIRRRVALSVAAAATVASTGVVGLASPAHAICDVDDVYYSTPYVGGKIWIPTSTVSDWKRGGRIVRSQTDGQSTAYTKGSQHSIGADGKIGGKIGPVGAELTIKYNYTWSKSTTTGTSVTRGWSYSFNVPTDTLYRARAYKLGWKYKFKRTVTYLGGCRPSVSWRYGVAPVKSNTGTYYWALEKYDNRGSYRYDGLR